MTLYLPNLPRSQRPVSRSKGVLENSHPEVSGNSLYFVSVLRGRRSATVCTPHSHFCHFGRFACRASQSHLMMSWYGKPWYLLPGAAQWFCEQLPDIFGVDLSTYSVSFSTYCSTQCFRVSTPHWPAGHWWLSTACCGKHTAVSFSSRPVEESPPWSSSGDSWPALPEAPES